MKIKANKIPLVGPRGRQEILKIVEQITKSSVVRPELSVILEEQTFDAVELDNPAAINAPYIVDAYGDFFTRVPDDAGNTLFGVATGYGITKVCAYFGFETYMENDAEQGSLCSGGCFYIVGRKNDNKLYYGYLEI